MIGMDGQSTVPVQLVVGAPEGPHEGTRVSHKAAGQQNYQNLDLGPSRKSESPFAKIEKS